MRLVVLACVVLLWQLDPMIEWSNHLRQPLPSAGAEERLIAMARNAGADVLLTLAMPPAIPIIAGIAAIGMLWLLVSLIAHLVVLAIQRKPRVDGRYLAVHPLREPAHSSQAATPRAIWDALLPFCTEGSAHKNAPLALTLHAQPDRRVELGMVLAGGHTARRAQRAPAGGSVPPDSLLVGLAQDVAAAIQGCDADCSVRPADDPLQAVLTPGRVLLWEELRLTGSADVPLRLPDPADALIPVLAAAMRPPAGIVALEVQFVPIVRPESLQADWRQRGRRRLYRLQRRRWLSNGLDPVALGHKLEEQRVDLTIRLVAVAEPGMAAAASPALASLRRPFAPLQSSGGRTAQRLDRAGLANPRRATLARRPLPYEYLPVGLMLISTVLALWLRLPILVIQGMVLLTALVSAGGVRSRRVAIARVRARAARLMPVSWGLLPIPVWAPPAVLSVTEAASCWTIPAPGRRDHLVTTLCRVLPVPAQLLVPTDAQDWLTLGVARRHDGVLAPVGLPIRSLRQILHLTAGVGTGKSQACAAMARQLLPHGLFLLDGKGDDQDGSLATTVRRLVPLDDEARLVIIDPLDADWPIGLNPLAAIDAQDPAGMARGLGTVLSILARLDPKWSEATGMRQYAQMASALLIETVPTPTLAAIKQVLQDEAYRNQLLDRCANVEVLTFWRQTFPKTSAQQKSSLDALLRRLDDPLISELTRYLLTIEHPTIDLGAAMHQGNIVVFALPHNTLGGLAPFVAMLVFFSIVRAAYRRPGTDQTRSTVPVIIDEFQQFVSHGDAGDVQAAISQLRALGIGLVLAHQSLSQLGTLRDELLQNVTNRLILQTGEPDASVYARMYANAGLSAGHIAGQHPREHQYAVLRGADGAAAMTSIQPLPWPKPAPSRVAPSRIRWYQEQPSAAPPPQTPLTDAEIIQLVYFSDDIAAAAERLARLPEAEWRALNDRWDQIRHTQRAVILQHPGCIPNQDARQRWLSRLGFAYPRVLAAASYLRQRWSIDPDESPAPVAPRAAKPAAAAATAPSPIPRPGPRPVAPFNEFADLAEEEPR